MDGICGCEEFIMIISIVMKSRSLFVCIARVCFTLLSSRKTILHIVSTTTFLKFEKERRVCGENVFLGFLGQ